MGVPFPRKKTSCPADSDICGEIAKNEKSKFPRKFYILVQNGHT